MVLSKCICLCHCLCLCICLCYCLFLVRSCLLVTLIKCPKGHKCVGSLCRLVKTLIVSSVRPSKGQGHQLSCSGQLKIKYVESESGSSISTLNAMGLVSSWKQTGLTNNIFPALPAGSHQQQQQQREYIWSKQNCISCFISYLLLHTVENLP